MSEALDASIVDLHRARSERVTVERVEGHAQLLREGGEPAAVEVGTPLKVGDTVALEAGAEVHAVGYVFRGGNHGRAHALVSSQAFRTSPSREDVPELLKKLQEIADDTSGRTTDPLAAAQSAPSTPHERASAAEFARLNLSVPAARLLSEPTARETRSVVLFISDETAFVALDELSVEKMQRLIRELDRPVHTHLVSPEVIDELLARVYGMGDASSWS